MEFISMENTNKAPGAGPIAITAQIPGKAHPVHSLGMDPDPAASQGWDEGVNPKK